MATRRIIHTKTGRWLVVEKDEDTGRSKFVGNFATEEEAKNNC